MTLNESLNVARRHDQHISKTTAYNILARYSIGDAEEKNDQRIQII
ncbi:MAG: hypothetical protein L0H53_14065 [Candidatus Nitrosocosmicus sp.]|nr:hypothetical protein [Candidatus Nitrosocosmicus sp.]